MKTTIILIALLMTLPLCGCGKKPDRSPAQILNAPASREEALALMHTVDEMIVQRWDANVAKEVRRRMTGRLLASGMTDVEIGQWIDSPIETHTNKEEQR